MASRSRVEFDEREFIREAPRRPVRDFDDTEVRFRDSARVPHFLREDNRRPEAGQLVLRQRDVETVERERRRSPSPEVRVRERIVQRARSVSPAPPRRSEEEVRIRQVEKVREPSRAPSVRYVERPRSPSPSVRERIRIVDRREERRSPSPAPPPPPQPQVIKGPTIEREVITHYRDIDHGMIVARPPSPPPQPRQEHRDTEIDIWTSRKGTEVDIHKHSHSHSRGRSVERPSRPVVHAWDDEVVVSSDRKHLHVDVERRRSISRGRRAHSAAPPVIDYDDEAYEIKSRIDARGKMGEAWNGITKDWTIVDVPPGTERLRMDGAGGASAEVTWQKYSGVRRAKFIPDRDEKSVVSTTSTTVSDTRERDRDVERERRLSVQIINKGREREDRDRDVEYEKVTDRRIAIRSQTPPPRRSETWTEITKDLVCREAIQELGYEFEETEYFYYIVEFLAHEDVVRLVQLSDRIRQNRKERAREIQWEREWRDEWEHRHNHHHSHSSSRHRFDDERIVEREIVLDHHHRHPRSYRH